jgi:hypothetical protein
VVKTEERRESMTDGGKEQAMRQRISYGNQIAELKKRLGASYVTIEDFATGMNTTIERVEEFLLGANRKHNLDLVWLGKEQVGPAPIFISRPAAGGFLVTLYSMLPQGEWKRP